MRFNRVHIASRLSLGSFRVVALRIELGTTCSSDRFGQPALGYHNLQSGWQDSNLRSRAPRARGFAVTLHPASQSERPDLNRGHHAQHVRPSPRPGAMPRLRYVLLFGDPCGSRTQPTRLERPMTSPEVERAVLGAQFVRSGPGGESNPRLLVFSQALRRLSYQPNKKPGVACDTGFLETHRDVRSSVTSAKDARRADWPVDRHNALCILVRLLYLT